MLRHFKKKKGMLSILWMAALSIYMVLIFSPASLKAYDEASCSSGACKCSCSGVLLCSCTSGSGACTCECIMGGSSECIAP
jgi:hypothetical protein